MKIDAPKDLVEQIKDGNCVVFVGAGLSQGAGLPNWDCCIGYWMLDAG